MSSIELSIFQIIGIGLFGFIFGTFEASTNLLYLIIKNYNLPRKQHGKELPIDVTDSEVYQKVIQMFCLGIILIIISIMSLVVTPQLFIVGATAIFLSGLIDYSKFRKKDMLIIWIVISIIASAFSLLTAI